MPPCSMNWIVHTVGDPDSASISECKLHKKEAASFMTLMNSPSSSIREIFPRDNDSPSIFLAIKEEIVLGLWFCMKLSGGFFGNRNQCFCDTVLAKYLDQRKKILFRLHSELLVLLCSYKVVKIVWNLRGHIWFWASPPASSSCLLQRDVPGSLV